MNLLITYIQNFLQRAGSYVLISTILSRLLSFLASWLALQFVPNKQLGEILFSYTIITFIIPFVGFGLPQGLVRYGALIKTLEKKKNLFYYIVKKGTIASLILVFILMLFGLFFPFRFEKSGWYLVVLAILLIPFFWFETLKIQYRLEHNNKQFSYLDILHSVFLVVFVLVLSYFFKGYGYIIALITAPTFTVLFFIKKLSFKNIKKPAIVDNEFYKYGFYASLANVATMLLFAIDILLIGYLLNKPEKVTAYRYVSLIPFSILFLPRAFMATDFVAFTEKIADTNFIKKYIKSYMLLFFIVSIVFVGFFTVFNKETLTILDANFTNYTSSFLILNIGVCGILIFRGLFGNLLSSIGKAKINYYISSAALVLNIISNCFLIPKYGIKGAAITSATLMWLTGIVSAILFLTFYKNYPLKLK